MIYSNLGFKLLDDRMNVDQMANEILHAVRTKTQITPFTQRNISLSNEDAYTVSRKLNELKGQNVCGRKIGFTNRSIWPIYGVNQPIWGSMDTSSVSFAQDGKSTVYLTNYCEPRVEPEIVIALKSTPSADMDERTIANCIDWIAPGFEIVDSIYPQWKFSIPDAIAAGGLHGELIIGQKYQPFGDIVKHLTDQRVALFKNKIVIEKGIGDNVLEGPISALQHLIISLEDDAGEASIKAGDIITTGTLTDAKLLRSGETWTATYTGLISQSLVIDIV